MEEEIEETVPLRNKGSFSFGMLIFSIFILVPITVFSIWAFNLNSNHELKMECLKQGRTYINDLCIQVTK